MAPETVPAFPWMLARISDKESMHGEDSNQRRGLLTVRCQVPTQLDKIPKSVVVAAGRPRVEGHGPGVFSQRTRFVLLCSLGK